MELVLWVKDLEQAGSEEAVQQARVITVTTLAKDQVAATVLQKVPEQHVAAGAEIGVARPRPGLQPGNIFVQQLLPQKSPGSLEIALYKSKNKHRAKTWHN